MKKRITVVISIVLLMALVLTACGGGGSKDIMEGTWVLDEVEAAGQKVSGDQLKALGMEAEFIFKDGKVKASVMVGGQNVGGEQEGTYKVDGDKLEMSGTTITVANNKFTVEIAGTSMTLKKK
ncbi:hypothetical protein LJB83_02110 [Clostridia bacterium OttesenSCG-928-F22]|nr:hypothetical protein [Clostridia bacterium OttesenSCG-928-F22]